VKHDAVYYFRVDSDDARANGGNKVKEKGISEIGPSPRTVRLVYDLSKGAERVEFWFRLVYTNGTIRPGDATINYELRLE
jgi:hypothetical protein